MDVFTVFAIVACLASAGVVFIVMQFRYFEQNKAISDEVLKAQTQAAAANKKLQGYTRYTDYLEAVKLAASSGAQSMAAKVVREYVHVENLPKASYKLIADAKVIAKYQVEFAFMLNLGAGAFEVAQTAQGVSLKVERPALSGTPVVKPQSHEIISMQTLPDERQALSDTQQNFSEIARRYGLAMANEELVRSVCKLRLIEYFHDFLAKQPGVQHVPAIFVDYK